MAILRAMRISAMRSLTPALLLCFAVLALAPAAKAEGLNCLISRGNLCFSTGCDNSGKSMRLALDLGAGSVRLCPNRFNDAGCTDIPMQYDIRDNAIIGITREGPEFSARSVFLNRVTGALTTTLVTAGGMAAVDFGTCELQR